MLIAQTRNQTSKQASKQAGSDITGNEGRSEISLNFQTKTKISRQQLLLSIFPLSCSYSNSGCCYNMLGSMNRGSQVVNHRAVKQKHFSCGKSELWGRKHVKFINEIDEQPNEKFLLPRLET